MLLQWPTEQWSKYPKGGDWGLVNCKNADSKAELSGNPGGISQHPHMPQGNSTRQFLRSPSSWGWHRICLSFWGLGLALDWGSKFFNFSTAAENLWDQAKADIDVGLISQLLGKVSWNLLRQTLLQPFHRRLTTVNTILSGSSMWKQIFKSVPTLSNQTWPKPMIYAVWEGNPPVPLSNVKAVYTCTRGYSAQVLEPRSNSAEATC